MRLFCGIEIPEGIKESLGALAERLKPLAKLAWSPPENLHVTTKFIGEWPEERMGEIQRALAGVGRPGPIGIGVRGLGWFPDERNPRVLSAGVTPDPTLAVLARDTEACLVKKVVKAGGPAEERAYHPHVTLARLTLARPRNPIPIDRLRREVAAAASNDFGGFRAESFFLYLSRSGRYSKLEEFPLK